VRLLRHDGEVEGVVVKDDAVLEFSICGRARCGVLRHEELVDVLRSVKGLF
jgi:hypothetical protein